jgi:NAD(P)-dependent dehydrogenase (short-subunit alcohol dehydrogenase family)
VDRTGVEPGSQQLDEQDVHARLSTAPVPGWDRLISLASRRAGAQAQGRPGCERVPLILDVTDPASVTAAAAAPDVNALVSNAGVLAFGSALTADLAAFGWDLATNYLGTLRVTRASAPALECNVPAAVAAHHRRPPPPDRGRVNPPCQESKWNWTA